MQSRAAFSGRRRPTPRRKQPTRGRADGAGMLYARDVPTGWIAIFRGGLELELVVDGARPFARWFSRTGAPLGFARWGVA